MLLQSHGADQAKTAARTWNETWGRGKTQAIPSAHDGRISTGKNVPLNVNIGMIRRNIGRLNDEMFFVTAVTTSPMAEKSNPPSAARGITQSPDGHATRPSAPGIPTSM